MDVRKLVLAALFISLSAVGGMIKIPLGIASIALDSLPALLAVLFFSAPFAALIAIFGHMMSAFLGGMPLGPFHLMIAAEMGMIVWLFAKLHAAEMDRIKWLAFIFFNGVIAAVPFYFLMSPAFFYATVPALLLAATVNAVAAAAAMPYLLRIKAGRTNHAS